MSRRATFRIPALIALALATAAIASPASASAAPDLSIAVAASPDPAVPGDELTVRLTAKNSGDAPATGAYIGLVMLGDVTLAEGPECVNILGRLAVCSVGTLEPGETARRTLEFADLKVGELTLQASASSDKADAKPADNVAQTAITIEPRADLKLGLQVTKPATATRANATVTATVRNSAGGPARETRLLIEVENGLSVVNLPTGCRFASRRVTCDLGTIDSRASATRLIALRPRARSTYSLIGGVTWSRRDATPSDNLAQALLTTLSRTRQLSIGWLVRGVPLRRECVHRRTLRLRVRKPKGGGTVSRVEVFVAGKRVRRVTGRHLRRPITLRDLPRGGYTVRVHTTLRDGRRLIGHRGVRACRRGR